MKVLYKSKLYKSLAVGRYFMLRLYYRSKFQCHQLSMIGSSCGIHIINKGKIICTGRIIVDNNVMLLTKGTLKIGKNFCINRYSRIVAHDHIEIGDHVTIGQMVSILDHDHAYSMEGHNLKLDGYTTQAVKLGSNIWIGDKCTILKGVTVGDNVIMGANTLVNKDVPSGVIIGGQPFKVLKNIDA